MVNTLLACILLARLLIEDYSSLPIYLKDAREEHGTTPSRTTFDVKALIASFAPLRLTVGSTLCWYALCLLGLLDEDSSLPCFLKDAGEETCPHLALTMDVSSNTIANCFVIVNSITDNMTFENSDEGGESTQELQNLIKELGYRNAMDVEDVLTHPEENVVAQLLTDEEIIESVIGIIKMISMKIKPVRFFHAMEKIRDEIHGEIDLNK
ncbi:hypothetical protein Tco_0398490 [Tanacetum coccineum]